MPSSNTPASLTVDPRAAAEGEAWARFGTVPVQVDAIAARWTPNADGINFRVGDVEHPTSVGRP